MGLSEMMKLSDLAKQIAAVAAAEHPDTCFAVYSSDTSVFVREATDSAPLGADIICIAQRWDERNVQLRFRGAYSEWRKV